jgi:hypothetical protein
MSLKFNVSGSVSFTHASTDVELTTYCNDNSTSKTIHRYRLLKCVYVFLVDPVYINSTNIPPVMVINRIYENQNLLSLQLVSVLVGLRT